MSNVLITLKEELFLNLQKLLLDMYLNPTHLGKILEKDI